MSDGFSFERVTARVAGGTVEFSFADGSTTSAPPHIVSKSSLLRDALDADSAEHCVCLPATKGLLISWLQLQKDMNSDAWSGQANSSELLHVDADLLSKYLKVSLPPVRVVGIGIILYAAGMTRPDLCRRW